MCIFHGGSLVRNAQPLRKLWPRAQSPRTAQQERCRAARALPLHQPRPPLRGPEVPAVLPRLAAAAGLAQASPRPPAHVGQQPRLAVGHVHPGQTLHERAGFEQPGGRFSMTHIKGSKCAMISRALSTSASPGAAAGTSSARGCIPRRPGWAKPCRSAPAPDVAQDGGLKFRHNVQGDDLPARRLEGPAHRLGAAEGKAQPLPWYLSSPTL